MFVVFPNAKDCKLFNGCTSVTLAGWLASVWEKCSLNGVYKEDSNYLTSYLRKEASTLLMNY